MVRPTIRLMTVPSANQRLPSHAIEPNAKRRMRSKRNAETMPLSAPSASGPMGALIAGAMTL